MDALQPAAGDYSDEAQVKLSAKVRLNMEAATRAVQSRGRVKETSIVFTAVALLHHLRLDLTNPLDNHQIVHEYHRRCYYAKSFCQRA
jgi:hypothetical protein